MLLKWLLVWKVSFGEQRPEVVSEPIQNFESFRSSLQNLLLRLKDLTPFLFGEYAHHFAHMPARSSENLKSVNARDQQGYAIVANHSDAFGIAVESLKFESGDVN